MSADVAKVAAGLTAAQRGYIRDAYPLSGASETWLVLDDEPDPLPLSIAHGITGRLTPLGLAVRAHLQDTDHG